MKARGGAETLDGHCLAPSGTNQSWGSQFSGPRRRNTNMRPPPPDFVIVGAPRCATTAIYRTLREHKDLFLPCIKDPNHFALEFGRRRAVESSEDYARLFSTANKSQLRGEASVMYLSSAEAIPTIVKRRPDVKLLAVVRNPVDLFISWHNQCVITLNEDITDCEQAWHAQAERTHRHMPYHQYREPLLLEYRRVCSEGRQVKSMFALLPEDQRLVLVLDDAHTDTGKAYRQIVNFLGIRDDGRGLSRENGFSRVRSTAIAKLAQAVQTDPLLKRMRLRIKPLIARHELHFIEDVFRRNLLPAQKPKLRTEFRAELIREFTPDVRILAQALDRDLSTWYRDAPPAEGDLASGLGDARQAS